MANIFRCVCFCYRPCATFFFLPKNTAPFDIFSLRSTRRCVMVRRHQHDMKCEHQCIGGQMVAVPAVPLDGDLAMINFFWLLMAYVYCTLNCQHTRCTGFIRIISKVWAPIHHNISSFSKRPMASPSIELAVDTHCNWQKASNSCTFGTHWASSNLAIRCRCQGWLIGRQSVFSDSKGTLKGMKEYTETVHMFPFVYCAMIHWGIYHTFD